MVRIRISSAIVGVGCNESLFEVRLAVGELVDSRLESSIGVFEGIDVMGILAVDNAEVVPGSTVGDGVVSGGD